MPLDVESLGPGDVLADKLRVVRRLGEGGMGAVFEVEHTMTRHRRALKLLHAHLATNAGVVQRFLREASAAGRIDNPHIAETFDAGQLATGELYLVMELLRGQTLTDHVASVRRALTLRELVDLLAQVCEGVAAAHAAGIVHRDLKPDNLFVEQREGRPFVKILDFGISKFDEELPTGTPLTREGQMLGTPYYMSPEQFKGQKDVDLRSDIYALGVIAYELAAGQRPYEGDTLPALLMAIATASRKPLREHRPDLPEPFLRLIDRALSPDRAERPESALALARELRDTLEGGSRSPLAMSHDETQRPSLADTQAVPPPGSPASPGPPRPTPVPSLVPPPPAPISLAPTLDPLAASVGTSTAPDVHAERSPVPAAQANRLPVALLLGAVAVAAVGGSIARLGGGRGAGGPAPVVGSASAVVASVDAAAPPAIVASSAPTAPASASAPVIALAEAPALSAASAASVTSVGTGPRPQRSAAPGPAVPPPTTTTTTTTKSKTNGLVDKGDFNGGY